MPEDPFDVLGVRDDAGDEQVRAAYMALAKRHHPDVPTGDADAFRRAKAAYEVLSDPRLRREAAEDRARRGKSSPTKGMSSFDTLFEDLARNGRGRDISRPVPQRGEDVRHEVVLTLRQAFAGGLYEAMTVPKPCGACAGAGRRPAPEGATCEACAGAGRSRKGKGIITVEVECPDCSGHGTVDWRHCPDCAGTGQSVATGAPFRAEPGIEDGSEATLPGLGGHGRNGGRSGDAILTVRVSRDAAFARKGADLAMRLIVPVWMAALGGVADYDGVDGGRRSLMVPAGSHGGSRFRVPGGGMPSANGRGILHITLDVEVPDASEGEMRKAFERVRALDAGAGGRNRREGAVSGH